jgi:hypothetical protein
MTHYLLGQPIRLSTTVRDVTGGLVAPSTIVLTLAKPDTSTQNYAAPTNDGTGLYHQDIAAADLSQLGHYTYKWATTGVGAGVAEGAFDVFDTYPVANTYTTLPELKLAMSIPPTDTADDEDLQDAILAASRAVEGDCGRHFYRVTEARTLEPGADPYRLRLGAFMDLVSVTTLKTDASGDGVFETTWQAADYQLLCQDGTPNVGAGPEARPYQRIKAVGAQRFPSLSWVGGTRSNLVEITGVWGWPAVPDRIRRAARMMATEIFAGRDVKFGAVGMADLGIIRVRENPKYMRLIGDYRLVEAAVPFA